MSKEYDAPKQAVALFDKASGCDNAMKNFAKGAN